MSAARIAVIAGALLLLAGLDGAFAGFRSSVGRTGRIDHRAADRLATRRGLVTSAVLLAPMIIAVSLDVAEHPDRGATYARAGLGMLAVYGPYGLVVLAALAAYAVLSWRWKYLASALILGPFTLVRPVVAIAGGVLAIVVTLDLGVGLAVGWAAGAVLAVEPVADRRWYGLAPVGTLER